MQPATVVMPEETEDNGHDSASPLIASRDSLEDTVSPLIASRESLEDAVSPLIDSRQSLQDLSKKFQAYLMGCDGGGKSDKQSIIISRAVKSFLPKILKEERQLLSPRRLGKCLPQKLIKII